MKSIQISWCTEDVIFQAELMGINNGIPITEEQADAILDNVEHYHDATIGINWDVIGAHIEMYMDKLEEELEKTNKFKVYLAKTMADIDAQNLPEKTFQEHYDSLIKWRDFDLLKYWLEYNGVLDGGEDMLQSLRFLVDGFQSEKTLQV